MQPRVLLFPAAPCCSAGEGAERHGAAALLRDTDSRIGRWGNPEHSVSLTDTPVSTHDKQKTHTHTRTTLCQAQPPRCLHKAANILATASSFVLGNMVSCVCVCVVMGAHCTNTVIGPPPSTYMHHFLFIPRYSVRPPHGGREVEERELAVQR